MVNAYRIKSVGENWHWQQCENNNDLVSIVNPWRERQADKLAHFCGAEKLKLTLWKTNWGSWVMVLICGFLRGYGST